MATPAEVVAERFSEARALQTDIKGDLLSFTTQLSAAIQNIPGVTVTWNALADPTPLVAPEYTPPVDYSSALLTAIVSAATTNLTANDALLDAAVAQATSDISGGDAALDSITTAIYARLDGTALPADIEAAIWDRARDREVATMQASIDVVTRDSEALGFALPAGVTADGVRMAQRNYYDKVSELSRDIAIKNAELMLSNAQKAGDQAIQIEGVRADVRAKVHGSAAQLVAAALDRKNRAVEVATKVEGTITDIAEKRSRVAIDAFRGGIEVFRASVDQDVKHWETNIRQYEAQQTYTFNAQKLNADLLRANADINLEAAKVGAQTYAQLFASAWSNTSVSAGVSADSKNSVSYSYNNDTSNKPAAVIAI